MSATVVWMDHKKAKLYHLEPTGMKTESVERLSGAHTNGHEKAMEEKFLNELANSLIQSTEILLMGPGTAKREFMHHLEKHPHHSLAKKVVGIETVDHPSDNQIIEKAKLFFKKFDMFAGA